MQICNVCSDQTPKYRCPACKIRYCSLVCYKKHKDTCLPLKPTVQEPTSDLLRSSNHEQPWTVKDLLNDDEQSDEVPLERLKLLGESAELKDILCNPHLRQLIQEIDVADSKADAMKAAMQEPLFVEFADQCLKVVYN